MTYARDTSVSVSNSRSEIERILQRYRCRGHGIMSDEVVGAAMIAFKIDRKGESGPGSVVHVRITLHLPKLTDKRFDRTPGGRRALDADGRHRVWEQACRSKWRSLCLILKAKLEAVEQGISTIEREFLPDVVGPTGQTVQEMMGGDVLRLAEAGGKQRLLGPGGGA